MYNYQELVLKEDLTEKELSYMCGYRDGYYGIKRNSPDTHEYNVGFDDGYEKYSQEEWTV
jgi:hypothetical protein